MIAFDSTIFTEDGPVLIDEDMRLDMIYSRKEEIARNYARTIETHERELEKIREELRRSPGDAHLQQLEMLYHQRINQARSQRDAALERIHEEERVHREKLDRIERERQSSRGPTHWGLAMYGHQGA